ncbi:MAG: trypsin-like peptidase domain-containing protein, partial [Verrucomicrobiales bacterium]
MRIAIILTTILLSLGALLADEPGPKSAEQIAKETRPALVAISHNSRPGGGDREGSGFFVGEHLIATNLHVIGDARSIKVVSSEDKEFTVEAVHASDRKLDLAILRVKEKASHVLTLGDSSELPDGQSVVAMGNPQGFRFSVVEGVISARREMDGLAMIQLAIPIEPGNSGGPLLDRQGQVIGIPSLKSMLTDNIGFAIPVNALKLLLDKPNPIPMERWVTVGRLSPRKWKPLQEGAQWRQRAGTITVRGAGAGFGGRSLCLYQTIPEAMPYEVAVTVKQDDEAGAAGLVFASDGEDRHYGFYPSGGQMRLTYFAGPDVFSWNILVDVPVPNYRPGDWNHLRVIVDEASIKGFVNGEEVVRVEHDALRGGQVGICKFRETEASYQRFRLGEPRAMAANDDALNTKLTEALDQWLKSGAIESKEALDAHAEASLDLLDDRARALDKQAESLRQWAIDLHHQKVCEEMKELLADREDPDIDLFHAGLLIAKLSDPDLDLAIYEQELDAMAEEIRSTLKEDSAEDAVLESLADYLFQQLGFHGSRLDFY